MYSSLLDGADAPGVRRGLRGSRLCLDDFREPGVARIELRALAGRAFPSEQSLSTIVLILAEEDERPRSHQSQDRSEMKSATHTKKVPPRARKSAEREEKARRVPLSAARSTAAAALAALAALATPGTALA